MGKVIKVIDLLNMIAKGEIPKKIKYNERVYEWNKKYESYHVEYENWWLHPEYSTLNNKVEILDEEQEIDIQSLEEYAEKNIKNVDFCRTNLQIIMENQNKIVQALKQLDNKIKEK